MTTETPEQKVRNKVDQWFETAGWKVIPRNQYDTSVSAVAVCEGLMEGHLEADYLLFLNGKAVGVLETKREEIDITSDSVTEQTIRYAQNVPDCYQTLQNPLPLLYKTNGKQLLFLDYRQADPTRWQPLTQIHTPKQIAQMLGITDPFAALPILSKKGLRKCQYEAITELERSFRNGHRRALMVLATGAGKTYTACLAAYRMLSYTPMRRILFLVDRNNLGKQAEGEFSTFRLTQTGDAFNVIYSVNRLNCSQVPSDSNIVISTIQRLFSLLKGEEITDTDDDEDIVESQIILPDNPLLPRDFFDLIIIDECHRSIYGSWRQVLEYFSSAYLVGLTATPIPETKAFFNNNIIVTYTLEESIVDGVNVDSRIFRIKTKVTDQGGAIQEGDHTQVVTRYTGEVKEIAYKETKNYTKEELNRSIINPAQIKLILTTYRNAVYKEMFVSPEGEPLREPLMEYLPKTLIFALNENHASNIVQIAKEVFAPVCPPSTNMDRYVQKITYSVGNSNELIRQFRNDKDFRIAVTCTLVATGTDVKPLEVVMFMRDIASLPLYTQMKGRGVRTIGDAQLQTVTPNATSKDYFFIVDAVGVTEHEHILPDGNKELSRPVSLKKLLEETAHGKLPDEYLHQLASTLARLNNKANNDQRQEFARLAHIEMKDLAEQLYSALDLQNPTPLPPYTDINAPNLERKGLVAPLADHYEARKYLLILAMGFITTILPPSAEDELVYKGFSEETAQKTTEAFEKYCYDHKDKIEALRILYNNEGIPITYSMLKDLETQLKMENNRFDPRILWNSYAIVHKDKVRSNTKKQEIEVLTNIIQLVRFAYNQIERLECVYPTARKMFNLWYGRKQMNINDKQKEVISHVVDYIASNGACSITDIKQTIGISEATQLIQAFGNRQKADEALISLFNFVVLRKTA